MNRLHAVVVGLLVSAGLAANPLTTIDPPPPNQPKPVGKPMKGPSQGADMKVMADPQGLDFGIVSPHTVLEGSFSLVNLSDTPLSVLQAVPSCQCTTIEISGKQIPAHGSLAVPVTMKVSSTGIKMANVKVMVQNQPRPITLDLRAEVAYPIRALIEDASGVPQPYIDAVTDPTRLSGTATVVSTDGAPFRVLSVQGQPAVVRDFDGAKDAPRNRYQVDFALPASPCEAVAKYLIIETDRTDARLIDMRVRHQCTKISPGLDIAEFRSNAGVIPIGGSGTIDLEVKKMDQNTIASVKSMDPRFTASLVGQRADGKSVMATIRLEPNASVRGVFLIGVQLSAADAKGRPYFTQRPEPAATPGAPPRVLTLPAEAEVLVYGKVE